MATVYEESRKVTKTAEGTTVVRRLRVEPYSEAADVADLLLGGTRFEAGELVRFPPLQDPHLLECWCQEVQIEGGGTFGTTSASGLNVIAARNNYDWAWLTCTYRTMQDDPVPLPGTASGSAPSGTVPTPGGTGPQNATNTDAQQEIEIATETFDFSAQQLTLPNVFFKWSGSSEALANTDTAITKTLTQMSYTLTRHFVVRLPFLSISKLLGRVNAAAFNKGKNTIAAETLRFDSANASRKVTNEGIKYFEITYKFEYRPIFDKIEDNSTTFVGWNRVYRHNAATPRWEKPVLSTDTNRGIYLLDSGITETIRGSTVTGFNLLFHPGAT